MHAASRSPGVSIRWLRILLPAVVVASGTVAPDSSASTAIIPERQDQPAAAGEQASPSIDERLRQARARLEEILAVEPPESPKARSVAGLIEILEAHLAAAERAAGFAAGIEQAPRDRQAVDDRIAAAESAATEAVEVDDTLALEEIRATVDRIEDRREALSVETASLKDAIERRQARRGAMREETASIAETVSRYESQSDDEIEHRADRIARRRAELAAIDLERRWYDATDDILRDRQRAIARESVRVDAELATWSERLVRLESMEAEARRAAAEATALEQSDPLAAAVAARNRELAERLTTITAEDDRMRSRLDERVAELDELRRSLESDRRRFAGRVTPAIATVLRQRSASRRRSVRKSRRFGRDSPRSNWNDCSSRTSSPGSPRPPPRRTDS